MSNTLSTVAPAFVEMRLRVFPGILLLRGEGELLTWER